MNKLPSNKRMKLAGARVGRIAFPRWLAFLSAAPPPCALGHCVRSLSAIRQAARAGEIEVTEMWSAVRWYLDQTSKNPLSVRGRALLGIGTGLLFGALLSLFPVFSVLFHRGAGLSSAGIGFLPLVLGYLSMGALGGALVGLLLPLGRRWPGALLLGFITAVPCWLLISLLLEPEPLVERVHSSLVLGAAFGPPLGFYGWYLWRRSERGHVW